MNDSFQSVRNDQSVRESLRDENFQQNQNVISSAESLQSVKDSQKTTYQVDNQIASTYATKIEITSADNNDAKHFVLVSEFENQFEAIASEMINQVDNRLISENVSTQRSTK